jgi:two-component system chemotaxis sensor kinase CheA
VAPQTSAEPFSLDASDDLANHELLAELLSQLSPEDRAEYLAKEQAEKELMATTVEPVEVVATPAPVQEEVVVTPSLTIAKSPVMEMVESPVKSEAASKEIAEGGKTNAKGGGAKQLNSTIKVDTGRVDSVLDAVGELVVLKNQLVHDETVQNSGNIRLEAIVDQLDKAVRELYEKTLSIRMTPLKSMFIKIQRIVRDVSLNLNKPVDLSLVGENTEVERAVFDILGDPLVHLVRNSMDHGVEPKELRAQRGMSQNEPTEHIPITIWMN